MPLTMRSKRPRSCNPAPYSHTISAYTLGRATKGVGRTQPVNWKDAGEVLGHDELKGCLMPDGMDGFSVRPGACSLTWVVVNFHREVRGREPARCLSAI